MMKNPGQSPCMWMIFQHFDAEMYFPTSINSSIHSLLWWSRSTPSTPLQWILPLSVMGVQQPPPPILWPSTTPSTYACNFNGSSHFCYGGQAATTYLCGSTTFVMVCGQGSHPARNFNGAGMEVKQPPPPWIHTLLLWLPRTTPISTQLQWNSHFCYGGQADTTSVGPNIFVMMCGQGSHTA